MHTPLIQSTVLFSSLCHEGQDAALDCLGVVSSSLLLHHNRTFRITSWSLFTRGCFLATASISLCYLHEGDKPQNTTNPPQERSIVDRGQLSDSWYHAWKPSDGASISTRQHASSIGKLSKLHKVTVKPGFLLDTVSSDENQAWDVSRISASSHNSLRLWITQEEMTLEWCDKVYLSTS